MASHKYAVRHKRWATKRPYALVLTALLVCLASCSSTTALPDCPVTVEFAPTGDIDADISRAWFASGSFDDADHPLTTIDDSAGHDKVLLFRRDGTGHVWWVLSDEASAEMNDSEFVWEGDGRELIVNDLPRAYVTFAQTGTVLIHPLEGGTGSGKLWHACDLVVPDGVRGE